MSEPEQNFPYSEDITHLDAVAIQVNEMFKALRRSGFEHTDAIQIVGIVLSSGGFQRYSYSEEEDDFDDMGPEIDLDEPDEGDLA